jgi:hypothetical protein
VREHYFIPYSNVLNTINKKKGSGARRPKYKNLNVKKKKKKKKKKKTNTNITCVIFLPLDRWKDKAARRKFFENIARELNFDPSETKMWYSISTHDISHFPVRHNDRKEKKREGRKREEKKLVEGDC